MRRAAFLLPFAMGLCPAAALAAVHADGGDSGAVSRAAFAAVTGRGDDPSPAFAADAGSIRPLAIGGSMDGHRFADGGISGVRSAGSDRPGSSVEVKSTMISRLPEPATWAMMVAGFGLAGYALRRRIRASERRFTERMRRIAEGRDA